MLGFIQCILADALIRVQTSRVRSPPPMPVTPSANLPTTVLKADVLADMPGCYTVARVVYDTHTEYEVVIMPGVEFEDFAPVFSLIPVGATHAGADTYEVDGTEGLIIRHVHNHAD